MIGILVYVWKFQLLKNSEWVFLGGNFLFKTKQCLCNKHPFQIWRCSL